MLYGQDSPGQVEGVIHQLSSVDHWNSLKINTNILVTATLLSLL